ncbi:hypothetical protein [Novosphingobium kaempferiae]|uniref:hypothetical protein n=1 Tax=Novosphingobium kaempferiae TaxID=2896849 RepID=UPI001E2A559E|nr:hypothetical protein [Novosphingobium kaempferiae]
MGKLAAQVIADKAARDAAKAQFDGHYQAFKADIDERGIGGRIADEAMEQAKLVFDEAVAVVEEHPAAIAGTLAALVLWFLRNPIIGFARDLADSIRERAS